LVETGPIGRSGSDLSTAISSSVAPGFFSDPGVLLADASIFASGGAHIELGDGDYMLDHPYFPNQYLLMRSSLQQAVRNYYDFFVHRARIQVGRTRTEG
jgi:dextranase